VKFALLLVKYSIKLQTLRKRVATLQRYIRRILRTAAATAPATPRPEVTITTTVFHEGMKVDLEDVAQLPMLHV
jgi:hypothetical protein